MEMERGDAVLLQLRRTALSIAAHSKFTKRVPTWSGGVGRETLALPHGLRANKWHSPSREDRCHIRYQMTQGTRHRQLQSLYAFMKPSPGVDESSLIA